MFWPTKIYRKKEWKFFLLVMKWFKFKCGNFEKQYYVTTILPTYGEPLVMFCMGALIKFVIWNEHLIFLSFITYELSVLYSSFCYWKCIMADLVLLLHVNSCTLLFYGKSVCSMPLQMSIGKDMGLSHESLMVCIPWLVWLQLKPNWGISLFFRWGSSP